MALQPAEHPATVAEHPREVEREYNEQRRTHGDPAAKGRPSEHTKRQYPSWLEQMQALEEQLIMAEERAERAEHEAGYFAAMMNAVAKAGKLDEFAVAEIRAKVRAAHEHAGEESER